MCHVLFIKDKKINMEIQNRYNTIYLENRRGD